SCSEKAQNISFPDFFLEVVNIVLSGLYEVLWEDIYRFHAHHCPCSVVCFMALDEKRWLYGTHEQNMGLLGFLRVRVWMNGLRSIKNGFLRVVLRERFVLGGIFFIGQGEQGILLEHREIEFGDKVNTQEVIRVVRRKSQELHPLEKK
uniref:Peroxiredoxin-like 2 activated in M-CSF stimulated monocytes n=1 Tax=Amphiprion ocellaris TaxID=80972 RepID=A0A3Q1CXV1_AMPOC